VDELLEGGVGKLLEGGVSELGVDASLMLNVRDALETHRCHDDQQHHVTTHTVVKTTKHLP